MQGMNVPFLDRVGDGKERIQKNSPFHIFNSSTSCKSLRLWMKRVSDSRALSRVRLSGGKEEKVIKLAACF